MQSRNYRGIDGLRGQTGARERRELECVTSRKCFVLLRMNHIHTKLYIQCSNLRRVLEEKAGAEMPTARHPRCPLRDLKRPWHRRSIPRWVQGHTPQIDVPRSLPEHFYDFSTTSTETQRLTRERVAGLSHDGGDQRSGLITAVQILIKRAEGFGTGTGANS